ncbi:MAG: succinate dehydrogenase/fumarate reductase iron-sulfur subunit [Bacteroidetes bacterium]|nr:MAG: succinate dehydrogenase/fumarate reductase iron-sulfur subunit [Bacteroidota bacterium]
MNFKLKIWRQKNAAAKGKFEDYTLNDVSPEMSFLQMLDYFNDKLITAGGQPVHFEHDCREGICGSCGLYINGRPHGPLRNTTTCELHMREFEDGSTIVIEPWRSKAFPIIKDLVVDRSSFEEVMLAGGFVNINTGGALDANTTPINKKISDRAFDAAVCIGCGACVAACKNSSASLFVSAKVSQFAMLPQGKTEAAERVEKMVAKMDEMGFGYCSNTYACEFDCPKGISVEFIAQMNREFFSAKVCSHKK